MSTELVCVLHRSTKCQVVKDSDPRKQEIVQRDRSQAPLTTHLLDLSITLLSRPEVSATRVLQLPCR